MSQTSDNQPASPSVLYRVVRTTFVTILVLFLLMFLLAGMGSGFVELIFNAVFGWVMFLQRTLPQISLNWSLIGLAAMACLGILGLTHWFLGWVTKAKNGDFSWPVKWTISAVIGLALLFLVGMSIGGIAHQIGWMTTSAEPLFERKSKRFYDMINMKQVALAIRIASEDEKGNLDNVRKALWTSPNVYFNQNKTAPSFPQTYHVLIITKPDGTIEGAIIFPRSIASQKIAGALLASNENDWDYTAADKLGFLLEKYKGRLKSL